MTHANRAHLLDFLRTGPKTIAQTQAYLGSSYNAARTSLNRLVTTRQAIVRVHRAAYLYEVKS